MWREGAPREGWSGRATRVGVTQGQETCCLRMPVLVRVCMFESGRRDAPLCSARRLNGGVAVILAVWRLESGKGPRDFFRERELGGEMRE